MALHAAAAAPSHGGSPGSSGCGWIPLMGSLATGSLGASGPASLSHAMQQRVPWRDRMIAHREDGADSSLTAELLSPVPQVSLASSVAKPAESLPSIPSSVGWGYYAPHMPRHPPSQKASKVGWGFFAIYGTWENRQCVQGAGKSC